MGESNRELVARGVAMSFFQENFTSTSGICKIQSNA